MSLASAPFVRTIAFGDLEAGVWGAAWWAQEAFATVGVVGAEPLMLLDAATLAGTEADEQWRLEASGVEIVLAPIEDAGRALATNDGHGGFDQLCRVNGVFAAHGAERALSCLGRRSCRRQALDAERFESLREVSAWCEPGEAVVVSSLRPRRARGHAADVITAALLEPAVAPLVPEPRLSTTYTAAGEPSRMSLELWLESDEQTEQYPRRVAGEAVGGRAHGAHGGLEFHAELLRCHSRGRDGAGVYLLINCR